ncbi:hypothetical protein GGI12_004354 [Dipsacomyces acuminosporus]|nr:hypothetical protein GGI12_004354 [Dipsacomyces acuminosporus]
MSSGPVYQILATPKDFSRRSIEESAIRDLVHAVVVMAVGHGLGSFANACGMVPDIDHPAGSYFDRLENLLPVEQSAGPPCIDTLGPDAAKSQQQPVYQPKQPTVDMVETAERNTAHLLDTLRELSFAEHSPDPVFLHIYQHSQPCVSQHPPPPPRSVLHRISGVSTRANALLAALTYTDPLENPQAQFAAYREMRKTKLARYELLPVDGQMLLADTVVGSTTTTAAYSSFSSGQPTVNSTSLSTRQSAFELGVHSYPQSATQASFDVMSLPSLVSQPRSVSQPHSPRQSQRIQSLHLSQRDDLHWDMLSGYLRQRLSIENDTLGNEVQAARTLAGRPLVDPDTSHPPDVDYAISLVDTRKAPLKAGRTQPTEERESDSMMYDDGAAVDIRSKVYDLANAMPMANVPFSRHYHKNIDTRHFHDAIWHFTLSFYHIYEEYYFYSKHKDDELPDNTQPDAVRRADTSDTSDTRHPASNSTFAAPASGAPTADMMMEVDLSADTAHTGQTKSPASPHYSRWLTKELKDHIRAVVRNSSSISAVMAQSPVATGLNLSAAELVRINLIISLAQRQAEITHGIRAIREFERTRL